MDGKALPGLDIALRVLAQARREIDEATPRVQAMGPLWLAAVADRLRWIKEGDRAKRPPGPDEPLVMIDA